MKIDSETTDLIVDVFRKINTLKKLVQLNGRPEKELYENASLLSNLLNKMLDDSQVKSLSKNLNLVRVSAFRMMNDYNHCHLVNTLPDKMLAGCLEDLYNDLTELFFKVNGRDFNVQNTTL